MEGLKILVYIDSHGFFPSNENVQNQKAKSHSCSY